MRIKGKVLIMSFVLILTVAIIGITYNTSDKETTSHTKGYTPLSHNLGITEFMQDTSIPQDHREAMFFLDTIQSNAMYGWAELPEFAACHDESLLVDGISLYAGLDIPEDEWDSNKYEDNYMSYLSIRKSLDPFNTKKYLQAIYAVYRQTTTQEEKDHLNQFCPGWEKWWQENYWSDDYVFPFPSDSYFANTAYCNMYNEGIEPIEYGVDPKKWSSDLEFIRAVRAGTTYLDVGWTPSTNKKNAGDEYYCMYYVPERHDFVRVTDCNPDTWWDGCFACKDQYLMFRNTDNGIATLAYYYIQENYDELFAKGEIYIGDDGIPWAVPKAPDSKYVWPMGKDEPNDLESYLNFVINAYPDTNGIKDTKFADRVVKPTPTAAPTATPMPTATPVPTEIPNDATVAEPTPAGTAEITPTAEPEPTAAEEPTEAPTEEPTEEPTAEPTPTPISYSDIPIASFPTEEPTPTPITAVDETDMLVATEATPMPTATQAPVENKEQKKEEVPTEERTEFPIDRVIPIVAAAVAVIGIIAAVVIIRKKRH